MRVLTMSGYRSIVIDESYETPYGRVIFSSNGRHYISYGGIWRPFIPGMRCDRSMMTIPLSVRCCLDVDYEIQGFLDANAATCGILNSSDADKIEYLIGCCDDVRLVGVNRYRFTYREHALGLLNEGIQQYLTGAMIGRSDDRTRFTKYNDYLKISILTNGMSYIDRQHELEISFRKWTIIDTIPRLYPSLPCLCELQGKPIMIGTSP